uniref:(California timema) hypothetical protein n=1 Tax=Timema californicum TaxID=61474 RepID=A0A7R9JI76_TIMCA|nr:unnamed protein product [Timema californicum]
MSPHYSPESVVTVPLVSQVNKYIEGSSVHVPLLEPTLEPFPARVSNIYYLLGDHYFKNNDWLSVLGSILPACPLLPPPPFTGGVLSAHHRQPPVHRAILVARPGALGLLVGPHFGTDQDVFVTVAVGKAIRHYLLDVCVNPVRLDSWAGMALARGSQLENRLNSVSHGRTAQGELRQNVMSGARSLPGTKLTSCAKHWQRASVSSERSNIDSSNSLLWVEYGSFVYMVHSFCSTVLKQAVNLSMEMFSRLECGGPTGWSRDERWLHHYMLGKVEEKQQDTPLQSLQQYSKALENLVANQAIFTRSVNYDNPDHLSMEAVEVVYRIHACVLKYLEQHEGRALPKQTCAAILEHLDAVRGGPFMDPLPTLPEATRKRTAADMSDGPTGDPLVDEVIAMMEEMLDKVCAESAPKRDEEVKVPGAGGDKPEGNKDTTDKPGQEKATISGELNTDVDQNLKDDENKEKPSKDVAKAPKGEEEKPADLRVSRENQNLKDDENKEKPSKDVAKAPKGEEEKPADLRVSRESLATNNTTDTGSDNDSSSSSSSGESSSSGSESSSSSSSGSDSSDSESDSSDSDSDSGGRRTKPESAKTKKEEETGSKVRYVLVAPDHLELVQRCVWMLEECLSRFPQHYKCFYRLAHYYLNSKFHRDTTKCRQLLLGTHPIGRPHCDSVYGLFAHRKNSNFFNDVWRNPVSEIDRPGSFVSHMSRSMTLLMELLKQQKDSKLLLELAIQLNKIPDPYNSATEDGEIEVRFSVG